MDVQFPGGSASHRRLRQRIGVADHDLVETLRAHADLVHVHFGLDAVDAWPSVKRAGLPMLVTLHGYDITTRKAWWWSGRGGLTKIPYPARLARLSREPRVRFHRRFGRHSGACDRFRRAVRKDRDAQDRHRHSQVHAWRDVGRRARASRALRWPSGGKERRALPDQSDGPRARPIARRDAGDRRRRPVARDTRCDGGRSRGSHRIPRRTRRRGCACTTRVRPRVLPAEHRRLPAATPRASPWSCPRPRPAARW